MNPTTQAVEPVFRTDTFASITAACEALAAWKRELPSGVLVQNLAVLVDARDPARVDMTLAGRKHFIRKEAPRVWRKALKHARERGLLCLMFDGDRFGETTFDDWTTATARLLGREVSNGGTI
jgi:hypothetical protein